MYTTVATVREMDGMADDADYPDTDIAAAIAYADNAINRFCGTTFGNIDTPAYTTFTTQATGIGTRLVLKDFELRAIVFPQTLTSVISDGVDETAAAAAWTLEPWGTIYRTEGVFPSGRNKISIAGTAGYSTTPNEDIDWASGKVAQNHLIANLSRVPDRALTQETEFGGTITLAQPAPATFAGSSHRAARTTGLPQVDARINQYRHRYGPQG